MTYFIITLDTFDGSPELIGPFADGTEAVDFASEQMGLEAWWVVDSAQATSPDSSVFTEEVRS